MFQQAGGLTRQEAGRSAKIDPLHNPSIGASPADAKEPVETEPPVDAAA